MYPAGTSRERKKKHALLNVMLCSPSINIYIPKYFKKRKKLFQSREKERQNIEGPDCKQIYCSNKSSLYNTNHSRNITMKSVHRVMI